MHWLEQKYISIVASRLRNYKRKGSDLYNFSCPFCGDSETDLKKTRGYVYTKKEKTLYHCHNCNVTHSFVNFLKTLDFQIFNEFQLEKLKDSKSPKKLELEAFVNKMKPPLFVKSGPLKGLKKISQLSADHPMKVYITDRKIPNLYHAKMFCCPKFFSWVNKFIPEKFSDKALLYDEARIIIPFIKGDKMHAFQGRSLGPKSKTRYITINYDDTIEKIYGLDTVDFDKKTYVFEGPIDSMFVPNSIATAGGDLVSTIAGLDKSNMVIVYDNEPRSKQTVGKIDKAILNGYNVVIWPSNLAAKDVNDMVLSGMSPEFIKYVIDTNTHRDLSAKLTLNNWSKV